MASGVITLSIVYDDNRWWGELVNSDEVQFHTVTVVVTAADGTDWEGQPVAPVSSLVEPGGTVYLGYRPIPSPGLVTVADHETLFVPESQVWSLDVPFASFPTATPPFVPDVGFRVVVGNDLDAAVGVAPDLGGL